MSGDPEVCPQEALVIVAAVGSTAMSAPLPLPFDRVGRDAEKQLGKMFLFYEGTVPISPYLSLFS